MAALCVAASWLASHSAEAQSKAAALTGAERLDFVTGPVIGSGRVVGLGGAYTALAVGSDGAAWNPAAYATRNLWDLNWFEWDVAFDYSPGAFRNTDFDNNGQTRVASNNVFVTVGGRLGFGAFGLGALLRLQYYSLGQGAQLQLAVANYGVGYALLDGQLVIGLGARTAAMTISDLTRGGPAMTISDLTRGAALIDFSGTGPEIGAILGLADRPYRIGVSARLAVHADRGSSSLVAAGLILPHQLVLPAEMQLGLAYQLGKRPLNHRFVDPRQFDKRLREAMLVRRAQRQHEQLAREAEAERLRASFITAPPRLDQRPRPPAAELADEGSAAPRDPEWWVEESRTREIEEHELAQAMQAAASARVAQVKALSYRYLLLSSEAIVIGTTHDGIGLESFLTQQRQVSGRGLSLGLRFGAEAEPIARRVRLRLGSYLEPSRFSGVGYRPHATVATDLRLFAWNLFGMVDEFDLRVGAYADIADRYNSIGIGIGMWH